MTRKPVIIEALEHEMVSDKIPREVIDNLQLETKYPEKYVGLHINRQNQLSTSYFIGCKWLDEGKYALVVKPKIHNLDYLKMFLHCLSSPVTSKALSQVYKIDLKAPPIELPAETFDLTPFIIIHFLSVLKQIIRKGLKRDYTTIEENLTSKIKGKILLARHVKHNLAKVRKDKNYCRYQEYSIHSLENKILKKTLEVATSYIKRNHLDNKDLMELLSYNKKAFERIEDYRVTPNSFKLVRHNNLYQEYREALSLAQVIMKRFGYSTRETATETKTQKFPPFHIDMSLLFEIYAYSLLHKTYRNKIKYQYHGKYGNMDFMHITEKIILDAKYKPAYKNDYIIDDIRQLSGYARDINVIRKMGYQADVPVIDCLILYPDQENGDNKIQPDKIKNQPINQFYKFYKYGIKLPQKKS